MAVVSVRELIDESFEWGDSNRKTRRKVFEVLVNNILDNSSIIEVAAGIPQIHSNFSASETNIKVSNISGQKDTTNPYFWKVSVDYTTDLSLPASLYLNPNPFLRKAEIKLSVDTYSEATLKAINPATGVEDIPVVNTSNEPFIPPMVREKGRLVLSITLHMDTLSVLNVGDNIYVTNNAVWYGMGIGTALLTDYQADQSFEGGFPATDKAFHWIVSAKVKYDKKGWNWKPMNMGKLQKITRGDGSIKYVAIRGNDHRPIANPMPLDANSKPIWPGSGLSFHYMDFQRYEKIDLNTLVPSARMP